jgi:hypothetical protein
MGLKLKRQQLRALLCAHLLPFGLLAAREADVDRFSDSLKIARVNDVELHYLEKGSGVPVIFIHGGLGDYREWSAQIGRFPSIIA